ncbi:hypothetical protein SLS60_003423 [Paraconiothyrium brasiliense]|uniref:Uncharacterized protein n=1 Tax=Paraconiothyrium brasiliense TaxID=300254 RepID=A0ABR3RVM8_9PLEO
MSSFSIQSSSKSFILEAHLESQSATSSDENTPSEATGSTFPTTPSGPSQLSRPTLCIYSQPTGRSDPILDNVVNLEHMELLFHFIQAKDLFSLGGDRVAHEEHFTTSQIFETCLQHPYLLHSILAFSARHLASIHPSKAASYLHQAITLQTRAVSLFNATKAPITKKTCVPILLFSTVLGHQVLADTLCRRDAENLDAFLVQFVQCLDTLRGVYVIFKEASPFWQETVLDHILSLSSALTSREPVGTRCQRVKQLVNASPRLSLGDKEACQVAIRYLQVGFDALLAGNEPKGNRYQMLFLWCILVPREFIALISAKNTEALVVLGHYAMLLGYGRAMWQVEDAGEYMLGLLKADLDGKVDWDWVG